MNGVKSEIVNPHGKPARAALSTACPRCSGEKRVASGGFGTPHPVCPECGYEWLGEVFRGQ